MENCIVCALLLAGCLFSIEICASPCFTGTRAVTWTMYAQTERKTWNEASRFCKERGGYLPVTNTHITMAAFHIIINNRSSLFSHTKPVFLWIGLHNAVSGEVPDVWEANCCLLPPDVQYWLQSSKEPDDLDTERCCRIGTVLGQWRTLACSKRRHIVCELDRGNCTYAALNDTTITTNPDASKADVPDVSACWSLCLQLRHEGKECVAAVLEQTTVCKLYVGSSLLEEDQVLTSPRPGSVVMLRRCFLANVSQESFPDFTFTDTSDSPAPANGACLDVDRTAVSTTDFLPPGVEQGLVTMATPSPPPSTTEEATEPETTTATSAPTTTTPSTTAYVSTPENAATTTVEIKTESGLMTTTTPSTTAYVSTPETAATTTVESKTESGTTAPPSTASVSTPETAAATTVESKTESWTRAPPSTAGVSTPETAATTTVESKTESWTTAPPSTAGVSTPETAATTTVESKTESRTTTPPSTASVSTPETAATTTVESKTESGTTTPSSTAGVSTPETTATTTVESKTPSGLMTTTNTATSPPIPPSTAVTAEAATSETPTAAAHVTPGDVTSAGANVPKQRLCPCSCPFKRNPPRQLPASLLPVIPLNATSKYRRSKTSVKMADTSHSVVGAPWVVACVSVFCLIVLCDLNRLKRQLGKRCRCKNKMDPEP